ncbi:hypothetical protein, partial [Nocardiopsis sp. NRRL B-16309]|uniref:hypothetical protein n=1 Tax=Nocardiopsis sp. NRRL B-16309 TaxID=1519494 RepID=UPI0006C66493
AKNPPGLIWRLAEAQALTVGPQVVKTRDCACGAQVNVPCPEECTETKGRRPINPRFALATEPPGGQLFPGPMSRWEYHNPGKISKRLREEGPDSTLPPQNRRQLFPFSQVLAWPAFDRTLDLLHLGVYVFIAAHTSLSESMMSTQEDLYRHAIGRRFSLSASRVSEITRHLEERKFIAKNGLVERGGHRHGMTGEPTSYVLRVMPPAGLMHPQPIRVSEWRDEDRITQRQEAVRSVRSASLRFPHTPSDLRTVDNSGYPQKGVCGKTRVGVWESEAVDVEPGELNTNPTTHPTTHPSPSVGAQAREGDRPVRGRGRTDGVGGAPAGWGHQNGAPAAAPAGPDPLVDLVERYVPRAMCRGGRADQEALAKILRAFSAYGFTQAEIEDAFFEVSPGTVVNPYAVVRDRIKSVPRFREHLKVVADRRAAAAAARRPRGPVPGRCGVHGTAYVPELSTPEAPFCLRCDQEVREEAEAALGWAVAAGQVAGEEWEPVVEEVDPEVAAQLLDSLRTASADTTAPTAGSPSGEDDQSKEPPPCGSCHALTRSVMVSVVSAAGVVEELRPCPECHPSMR